MREIIHMRLLHKNKLELSFCGSPKNPEAIDTDNYSHEIRGNRKNFFYERR